MKKQNEPNKYEQQAQAFLDQTGTTLSFVYTGHRKYFPEDDRPRACYQVTLSRSGKQPYTFDSGQSINESWDLLQTDQGPIGLREVFGLDKAFCTNGGTLPKPNDHLTLVQVKKEPSAYDILAGLDGYDPGTFHDFCDSFGYNNDSMKAFEIYKKVQEQYAAITRIFTDQELDQLNDIC